MSLARGRVLVSGGAGFIGSHLCERLLADGFDVLCVDNFYSSTRDNIAHLLDNPRFEIIRHDVTFPLFVEVDQIFHLACFPVTSFGFPYGFPTLLNPATRSALPRRCLS